VILFQILAGIEILIRKFFPVEGEMHRKSTFNEFQLTLIPQVSVGFVGSDQFEIHFFTFVINYHLKGG
jgi:hypothetical protein